MSKTLVWLLRKLTVQYYYNSYYFIYSHITMLLNDWSEDVD